MYEFKTLTRAQLGNIFPNLGNIKTKKPKMNTSNAANLQQENELDRLKFPRDLGVVAKEAAAFVLAGYWNPGEEETKVPAEGYMIACVPSQRFSPDSPTGGIRPDIYRRHDVSWWEEKPSNKPRRGTAVIQTATAPWADTDAPPRESKAPKPSVKQLANPALGFLSPEYDSLLLTDKGRDGEQCK